MHIIDLYGKQIQVTDLTKAIAQTESFVGNRHSDSSHEVLDKNLNAYWQDMLDKLKQEQSLSEPPTNI